MPRKLMPGWQLTPTSGRALQFERIAINQGALCIECVECGRRIALTKANCPQIRSGNKRLVKSMTFRCSSWCCGSTDVRLYNAHTEEQASMWLAGDPLRAGRKIR